MTNKINESLCVCTNEELHAYYEWFKDHGHHEKAKEFEAEIKKRNPIFYDEKLRNKAQKIPKV